MSKKKNYPKLVTPAGPAGFSKYIHQRDSGEKYSNDKFKAEQRFDAAEVDLSKIEAVCKKTAKDEWGKVPEDLKLPFAESTREEDDGVIILKASSKFEPTIVDAKRQPLPDNVKVFGGDIIKLSATTYPYVQEDTVIEVVNGKKKRVKVKTYGISLQLRGVQLLEKKNGGGADAADDFDEEEDYEPIKGGRSSGDDFDGGDDEDAGDDVDDF